MSKSHTNASGSGAKVLLLPDLGPVGVTAAGLSPTVAGVVEVEMSLFTERMRDGLMAAATAVGLAVLDEVQRAELDAKVGPKGKHIAERTAVRHGVEESSLPMGGRRVAAKRHRARAIDGSGEVELVSWSTLASTDLLNEHTVASMLAGVSTRDYAGLLEPVGVEGDATSKSAVSRRFVKATKAGLDQFRSRRLDDRRWLVVFIDGFGFEDELMLGALGVDTAGNKLCLSVRHGSTENATVCRELLNDLERRGFDPSKGVLFCVDGGTAIGSAIRKKWGDCALIQRCRAHKSRNVTDLVPAGERPWVAQSLQQAWAKPDANEARKAIVEFAAKLERTHPDAAASLREGLDDTITINRLGVTGTLAKTLETTNPMESTVDIVRTHARNVKRWLPGDMRLRWAAAGMVQAEGQYRRVKGHRGLDALARAIEAAVARGDTAAPTAA
jgi:putative transposase